jgi:hypothetical protein
MFTIHDWRGRHWQAARNLTIAVATAALAGGGAAMAADGGAAPSSTKAAAVKPAPKTGERLPLAEDEPVVTQARTRLESLVADGAIGQAEADTVLHSVIAGSVDPEALVRAGKVSAAHMPAIVNALDDVKRANAAAGGVKRINSAAVKRAKTVGGG